MKKILVPTDFSEIANKALDVAVEIAKKINAKIELLNVKVYPTANIGAYYSLYGASGVSIDDAWEDVLKAAKKEMKELISRYSGVQIKPLIEETSEHFVESVLEHKADLIVMGSNGAEGFKQFFSGSNSEEVVRMASCPVLVVKDSQDVFEPRKVVVAVDFIHEEFIKKAIDSLPLKNAEFHFLHVDDGNRKVDYLEAEAKMHKLAKKLGLENCKFEIFNANTVEYGIQEYAETEQADLIVMYTHGRTGVAHFFKGSVAESVVNHAKTSVFTYVEN
jgi:nucleotide-binding universal stress UspA family protein